MNKPYKPPHSITPAIIHLISKISEAVGRLSVLEEEKICSYAEQTESVLFKVHWQLKGIP